METETQHEWPADDGHLWGPWMTRTRTEQYRKCVHPECTAINTREAPKG